MRWRETLSGWRLIGERWAGSGQLASAERYRKLADALPEMIWTTRPDGTATFTNAAMRAYFGPLGPTLQDRLERCHPEDRERARPVREAAYADLKPFVAEVRLRRHDGEFRWHRMTLSPLKRRDQLVEWLGTALDVDDARRAEQALRDSEERWRVLADNLPDSMLYQLEAFEDGSFRYLSVSANCERLNGITAENLIADPTALVERVPEEYRTRVRAAGRAALRNMSVYRIELPRRMPDGEVRWFRFSAGPRRLNDGRVIWDGIQTEVTAQKAGELALRDSEARYRALAESLPALVWVSDPRDGRTVFQNERLSAYTGRLKLGDLQARLQIVHPDDVARLMNASVAGADAREPYEVEARLKRWDGTHRWHLVRGVPIASDQGAPPADLWLATAIDIEDLKRAQALQEDMNVVLAQQVAEITRQLEREMSGKKRAEAQLFQAQKLDALGRLTGGIAHDLNNNLQVVTGNVDAAIRGLNANPQAQRGLLSALVAADRAGALVAKLLAFAQRQSIEAQVIDVAQHLASVADLLNRSMLGDNIVIALDAAEGLWPLDIDAGQLEQVVVNLVVNARDAMPGGGAITIAARNHAVDAFSAPDVKLVGDCVLITVSDAGAGMSRDVVDRAFEPFFTTKTAGGAVGLGLSQVYGFVTKAGGVVHLKSEPEQGTTVSIYLPRAAAAARLTSAPVDDFDVDEEGPKPVLGRVLVVDDDPEVAATLEMVLRQSSYVTRAAIGSEAALEALTAFEPDVVLSDVTMPGGPDGFELTDRIRALRPQLPVLLITGNPRAALHRTDVPIVTKPITGLKLHEAIQRQLRAGEPENVVPLFPAEAPKGN